MPDVFISHAQSTIDLTRRIAEALRALGHDVWWDDELPVHKPFTPIIEERLTGAKAVVVIWSNDAVKSTWVPAEAEIAREAGKLVQISVDGTVPPLPLKQIQYADLTGWHDDTSSPAWRKVITSVADLIGGAPSQIEASPTPALPLPSKPSIAVMPFTNLSADPEQEYFADGMVVEIVTALSRFKSIFVIASGSSLTFKGKGFTPQAAARALGVRYVLQGSVRQSAGRVRIGIELIDAADGAQIWTGRFDDTLEDVFALQDKVAIAVAGIIGPAVQEVELRQATARPTKNMDSYDLYLQARSLFAVNRSRPERLSALALLERVIVMDPNYGQALGFAALCYYWFNRNGWLDDSASGRRRSIELAHRALRIAGDDAEVLTWAAGALREENAEVAAAMIERALALNPALPGAWWVGSQLRLDAGEFELAAAHIETAIRLDPLSPQIRIASLQAIAELRFLQGRFGEAAALIGQVAQLWPDHVSHYGMLAACHAYLGQADAAREALARFRTLSSRTLEDHARQLFLNADHRKLLLDGIALAEEMSAVPD